MLDIFDHLGSPSLYFLQCIHVLILRNPGLNRIYSRLGLISTYVLNSEMNSLYRYFFTNFTKSSSNHSKYWQFSMLLDCTADSILNLLIPVFLDLGNDWDTDISPRSKKRTSIFHSLLVTDAVQYSNVSKRFVRHDWFLVDMVDALFGHSLTNSIISL